MDALGNVRSEDDQHALRRHFIAVMKSVKRAQAAAYAAGMEYTDPGFPRWPDMSTFSILRCGAKTKRHGTPCSLTAIYANGRCKFHGGLSTGPKTAEGKIKAAQNGLRLPAESG
jgi:hypothetical protein